MIKPATQITLYSRRGCELCEEMIAELEFAVPEQAVEFSVIDIDTDPQLVDKYGLDVPVLMLNGVEFCRHRLDIQMLQNKLSKMS